MLLYHGTSSEHVKSIRCNGLVPPTDEDWQRSRWSELGLPPSTFMATQPRAGDGSNPLQFAKRHPDSDGYIVVVRCSWQYLAERLRGIWSTWDVMFYVKAFWVAVNGWQSSDGRDDAYTWALENRPDVAKVLLPGDRDWLVKDNPEWLLARRLERPTEDCQVVSGALDPACIVDIVRVYDCRSRRIVPGFDPKRQPKLKHKNKTFASLFRNHVLKGARRL